MIAMKCTSNKSLKSLSCTSSTRFRFGSTNGLWWQPWGRRVHSPTSTWCGLKLTYLIYQFATVSADVLTMDTWSCSSLPAKHYDADTTEPISCGLHTLDELLSWSQNDAHSFNVATVPLSSRKPTLGDSPQRTLVSHDMMGGYLDDRWETVLWI